MSRFHRLAVIAACVLALLLYAVPVAAWWVPPATVSWQIQYSGTMNYGLPVQVYDLDGFDTTASTVAALHARGVKVLCYFSAGSAEDWRPDYSQFPASALGKSMGWPGEVWVDIRDATVQTIMANRIQMCHDKGFDATDADNVDGYENDTGFLLTDTDEMNYNTFLAGQAHNLNLGAFLKNDTDQVSRLVPAFDGEVVEQCVKYKECAMYDPMRAAGKPVLAIEYGTSTAPCATLNAHGFNGLIKHKSLDAYRIAC